MVRATQADDTTDAQHPLDNLDVIRVNPDDVIAAMRDYHESPDDGRMQVLRVTPPHEGESDAELWTSEQGRSYLDSPAPKHIDPEAFVSVVTSGGTLTTGAATGNTRTGARTSTCSTSTAARTPRGRNGAKNPCSGGRTRYGMRSKTLTRSRSRGMAAHRTGA